MAGMLPGVEAARRRICNNITDGSSIIRPSFCLYASNHDFQINSTPSMHRNKSTINQTCYDDEKLEVVAREAKKRLDHKLKTHSKSEIKSSWRL